ncbi:DUF4268 domain-containing protein [Niabella insulamsoli]|uniref:DUF4268 domain-containing protein n=1 Tax=Niabella insulamsoli TaxID=3144874 RepID=UPI0031FD0652
MYSRSEASNIRKAFWTTLGQYLKPVKNAAGETINWVNYKTGVRHIYFRMDAGKRDASVAIEIKHPSADERATVFDQFVSVKKIFEGAAGPDWDWQPVFYDEDGSAGSRIFSQLEGVSVFNKENWPQIISFLKERIIHLDQFWASVKFQFEP